VNKILVILKSWETKYFICLQTNSQTLTQFTASACKPANKQLKTVEASVYLSNTQAISEVQRCTKLKFHTFTAPPHQGDRVSFFRAKHKD